MGYTVPLGQTHLVTQQLTPTEFKAYINGSEKKVVNLSTSPVPGDASTSFALGARSTSYSNAYFDGRFAEIMVIKKDVSDEELSRLNYCLSKKWNLTDTIDSDGDGTVDVQDEFPLDATKSFDIPDLSDTVDTEIGDASGLDSVEGDMVLWLDASNINAKQNEGLNNGDAISEWKDLSGNGYDLTQTSSGYAPVFSIESNRYYVGFCIQ